MKFALFVFLVVLHNTYAVDTDNDAINALQERILGNVNELRKLRLQVTKAIKTEAAKIEDAALRDSRTIKQETKAAIAALVDKRPPNEESQGCEGQATGDLLGLLATQNANIIRCTQLGLDSDDKYIESIVDTLRKLEDLLLAVQDIRNICPRLNSEECVKRQVEESTAALAKLDETVANLKHNEQNVRQAAKHAQEGCVKDVIKDIKVNAENIVKGTERCISNIQ